MAQPSTVPLGLQLTRTAKAVSRAFDERLHAAGGTRSVWLVLLSLKSRPIANQRELAAAVGIEGATLSKHLEGMENAGLIDRRRDPANRRVHLVTVTEAGDALFEQLRGAAVEHDQRIRRGLTARQQKDLAELLGQLATNVTPDGAPPDPQVGSLD